MKNFNFVSATIVTLSLVTIILIANATINSCQGEKSKANYTGTVTTYRPDGSTESITKGSDTILSSDENGNIRIGNSLIYDDTTKSVGLMPKGWNPTQKLYINPNGGRVGLGKTERTITISIERYNKLTEKSEWELIDYYEKNSCRTSLWKNKETNEVKEAIGTYPPSKLLIIK